jgi:serine/threonine-protein kinase RsbT
MIENKQTELKRFDELEVKIQEEIDYVNLIYIVRRISKELNFKEVDEVMIATVASELAMNIYRYAESGIVKVNKVFSSELNQYGLEILAEDYGPGISNLDLALTDKFSTTLGSLGQGLPSVKRNMDEFYVETSSKGTRILVYKWRKHER